MSSGKPQTRGLAALLRIEKERREREETGADEPADLTVDPTAEGGQGPSAPHVVPHKVEAIEPERAAVPAGGGETADTHPESFPRNEEEATAPPDSGRQSDLAAAPSSSEGGKTRQTSTEQVATPVTSLPRPRPAPASPARASRKKADSPSEPALVPDPGWEKFVADWKPFLRDGVKFNLCEFFYRNTVAVGRREFTTSTAQLSRVSGAHRRHIFLVLRQLEELRFIRKQSVETNRKDAGLVITFFPDRQA
jgi:hypothetical protein